VDVLMLFEPPQPAAVQAPSLSRGASTTSVTGPAAAGPITAGGSAGKAPVDPDAKVCHTLSFIFLCVNPISVQSHRCYLIPAISSFLSFLSSIFCPITASCRIIGHVTIRQSSSRTHRFSQLRSQWPIRPV